jgi:nuclear cap-binding protein subunit 2
MFPTASALLSTGSTQIYWDRKNYTTITEQLLATTSSRTVYIGNLGFDVTVERLCDHFSSVGAIKKTILGINKNTKTPCGFAFIEYHDVASARDAVNLLSGSKFDERLIRVEMDPGFRPGRQYGRGSSGGQVRDDRRKQAGGFLDASRTAPVQPPVLQQAPERQGSQGGSSVDPSGHYGPSAGAATGGGYAGSKRGRDEEDIVAADQAVVKDTAEEKGGKRFKETEEE